MFKNKFTYHSVAITGLVLIVLFSCNNHPGEIPFPEKELSYSQPVTVPLQFTAEKKLTWDTAKQGGIKPVIKKLDIYALPATVYDSSDFKPFAQTPQEVHFDVNKLPQADFKLENLTSIPLQFKTSVLPRPAVIKTSQPVLQKGKALSIFEFGLNQGLPAKFVTGLLKDRNGLMWIASGEGLFRYDGEHVKVFIPGPLKKFINGITEDNNGNIWFTQEGSVGMIDLKHGTIHYSSKIGSTSRNLTKIFKDEAGLLWVYNYADTSVSIVDPAAKTFKKLNKKLGLADSAAFEILQDNYKNIWITTFNGGANIIDLKAGKIKYLRKADGLSSDTLTAMTIDKAGQVWLSETSGKLNAVDLKRGIIKQYNTQQNKDYTFYLSIDNRGRIWKGSSGGLEIIDPENNVSKALTKNNGIANNTVLSCTLDDRQRMWIATVDGLNIIEQNGETVYPMGQQIVITMMDDGDGNLWVGTDKGIMLIDAKKNAMRLLNKSKGLGNEFIQSFTKFNQQIMVTSNGGLDVIDLINKTIEHTGKKEGLVSDTTYVVFKDKENNTWLTGPSNGIDLLDAANKNIRHTERSGGLSDNNIQDVKQDKSGLVWLATNLGGIDVVNMQTGTVKYLNNLPGLKDTCNRMMLLDKYGRMWIGSDKGIYVADTKANTVTAITAKQGLPGSRVLSLMEYKGNIIVGTNAQSAIIKAPEPVYAGGKDTVSKWEVAILDKTEGLIRLQPGAWSTDCISPSGQYLWGDRGLVVIDSIKPNTDSVITHVTGINVMTQSQNFVSNIDLHEKDTLWTSDSFYVKGQKPVTADSRISKGISWDSVSGPYNLPVNLQLPHDHNYLQFQFVQVHLGRQDTTWYTYMLEGIDRNWSAVTANTFTENYLNLPPGNYTFKACSKGTSGKWSAPATFKFTITPPWYQTWWAYALFALLAIGLLRAYIVYRSRMLKEENRILEEKVNQRTNQLQKSLEELKATQTQLIQSEKMASLGELTAGIAHEIQNPLNFINNFSEVNTELISEMKEEIEKGNLNEVKSIADAIAANEEKITHHGKRADGIVKGMLQHSRTGNRQKEPADINGLADEYLRLAYHGLRAKDKSFNASMKTDFDGQVGNINIITQDIGRVILNLITNAFYAVSEKKKKHPEDYDPTVIVSTKKIGSKVEIRVKDNGDGIPQKVLDKIFQPFFTTKPSGEGTGLGLSLSYDIVKAHNGELKVETKEGEGAEFIIILPQ